MTILASADIRNNYNGVVEMCKETGEPIYLTKNGQGELVVMDIASFERREQELRAQQMVLEALAGRLAGDPIYSHEQVMEMADKFINGK